jgi:shikimate dehydrogenase
MTDPHSLYGLIGHPVGHVRSPGIFNAYLEANGLPGRLVVFDCKPNSLQIALDAFRQIQNLKGLFVTMPHKKAITPLLDGLTDLAAIAGAVNVVRRTSDGRLIGGQLDGPGFVAAMIAGGSDPSGKKAFIAGAGGVSAGICCALAKSKVRSIVISNRNLERSRELCNRLQRAFPATEFAVVDTPPDDRIDIVINATSVGINSDDPLPVSLDGIRQGIFVGDVVNVPKGTRFTERARDLNCKVQNGDAMFPPQIPLALDFFKST